MTETRYDPSFHLWIKLIFAVKIVILTTTTLDSRKTPHLSMELFLVFQPMKNTSKMKDKYILRDLRSIGASISFQVASCGDQGS